MEDNIIEFPLLTEDREYSACWACGGYIEPVRDNTPFCCDECEEEYVCSIEGRVER